MNKLCLIGSSLSALCNRKVRDMRANLFLPRAVHPARNLTIAI